MSTATFDQGLPEALTQAENLPSLPAVAVEVLRLSRDEEATVEQLASVISRDPALAAKLLKLSNSSMFNPGGEVTTLSQATMVLGMKTVKLMSLSFSLVSAVPHDLGGGFDYPEYWRRSLVAAVAGRSLCKLVRSPQGDEAFLCGLLSNIGQLVIASVLRSEYEGVLAEVPGAWPSIEVEDRVLGFNHCDVGAALLKSWGLPSKIVLAVAYMQRPQRAPKAIDRDVFSLVCLLKMADLAVQVLCDADKGEPLAKLHRLGRARFDLTPERIDAFLVGLESGITETAEMLSVELDDGEGHEALLESARRQIARIGLGTVIELRESERRTGAAEAESRALADRALRDPLTGVPSRAGFDRAFEENLQRRIDGRVPLALGLILVDVDRTEGLGDARGRAAGDDVLKLVARTLTGDVRGSDLVCRWGDERFAIVCPQTTPAGMRALAERLRLSIESATLEVEGRARSVTASFGAACIARVSELADGGRLGRVADAQLQRARSSGGNRVEVYLSMALPAGEAS